MCFRNITDENELKVVDYLCSMNATNELDDFFWTTSLLGLMSKDVTLPNVKIISSETCI